MNRSPQVRFSIDSHLTRPGPTLHQDPQAAADDRLLREDDGARNLLPRVLALVFPQFHEDDLNSRLWGPGFTDWDSLRRAPRTNREGFAIPRPTELGYYDYGEAAPRQRQGELARAYGIDGFVFHHYWFYDPVYSDQPRLHRPLLNMLRDGYPDVPFALHWCNTKWINTWNAKVQNSTLDKNGVLQNQYFPANDDEGKITKHYDWLKQFFDHPKYIKVDGKPLLMMYQKKPGSYPVLTKFKELAMRDGYPGMYFTIGLTKPHEHLLDIGDPSKYVPRPQSAGRALFVYPFDKVVSYPISAEWNRHRHLEVPQWCRERRTRTRPRERDIAGVLASFDNTPRRGAEEAHLWSADAPDAVVARFRRSLHAAVYYEACCFPDDDRAGKRKDDDDRFVLINAMNEWAEGMALEPSDVYGRRFLETIREVKLKVIREGCAVATE